MTPLTMSKIEIDSEFESLLPRPGNDERAEFEANVKQHGFTDPIIVWLGRNILIDGHNRYRFWKNDLNGDEHLAPGIVEKAFETRDEVKEFIYRRQLARRNLTDAARVQVALKLKPYLAAKAKVNQTDGHLLMNSSKGVNTRKELAELANVSEQTVDRFEKVLETAPEETKVAMLSGDMSINAAHNSLKKARRNQATELPDGEAASIPMPIDGAAVEPHTQIPTHLLQVIEETKVGKEIVNAMIQLKKRLGVCTTEAGSWNNSQHLDKLLDDLMREFKFNLFASNCPHCKNQPSRDCRRCHGRGWINRSGVSSLTDEERRWLKTESWHDSVNEETPSKTCCESTEEPAQVTVFTGRPSGGTTFNPDEFDPAMTFDPEFDGKNTPKHLTEVINSAKKAKAIRREIGELKKEILDYANSHGGEYLDKNDSRRLCDQLIANLKHAAYECNCPRCKNEPLKKCELCQGRGFVSHGRSRMLTDAEKNWLVEQK